MTVSCFAASDVNELWSYTLTSDDTDAVIKGYKGTESEIVIPETIDFGTTYGELPVITAAPLRK